MEVARKHGIKSFVGEQNLQEVYSYLRLNLCSASHVVRLITLKILSCFDQPERSSSDSKVRYSQETLLSGTVVIIMYRVFFYSDHRLGCICELLALHSRMYLSCSFV